MGVPSPLTPWAPTPLPLSGTGASKIESPREPYSPLFVLGDMAISTDLRLKELEEEVFCS